MLTFIKDNRDCYTVYSEGESVQFGPDHPCYKDLVECIKTKDMTKMRRILNVGHAIEDWSEGNINMREGILYYGEDEQIHPTIQEYVITMIKDGFDKNPIVKFLERLFENPSYRAINELYSFMQNKGLPISPDGYLIAHKGVTNFKGEDGTECKNGTLFKNDLVDKWSGKTFLNEIGSICKMPRRQVEDNCNKSCGPGLHAGSFGYAKGWTDIDVVVTVKIDPKDVVSIPTDCGCQKLRCCEYEVIGVSGDLEQFDEPVYEQDEETEEDTE